MQIKNNIMRAIFNSRIKVNILLYLITLALRLIIRTNVIMYMKRTGNYKLLFIKYVSYVPVQIRNIII